MKTDILEDLLHNELRSLYSAEKRLLKTLTKMAGAASHPKLQAVFKTRLRETSTQIKRLEHISTLMCKRLDAPRCKGMEQLIEEGESLLHALADEPSDVHLIAAAQHVGCYEIEGYSMARTLASRLGLDEIELMLQQNLDEEKAAAARLAKLAKSLLRTQRGDSDARMLQNACMTTMHLMA